MFDSDKKPTIEEQLQNRKRFLKDFDSKVMELALGSCTVKARSNALELQQQNHRHYEHICDIEDALREAQEKVQKALDGSFLVSLEQNGLLELLRVNRFPELGET